jgi:formate hydrogenlyase subunit 4
MSVVLSLLTQILHIGLMILAAPTVAGMMHWLDGRLSGHAGPPILQPWHDLVRLSRKTPLTQESVSVVSRFAPAVGLGATLSAAALVPSFALGMALSPLADVVVIVSLLTVARVAGGLAALDSGSSLPGLITQASSVRAILAEPSLMLAVFTLAPMGGSFNLDTIIGQQHEGTLLPTAASAVTLCALLVLVFADTSDADRGSDQILSGTDLAFASMTMWLRRLIWIDLVGGVFVPAGMAAAESGPLAWLIGLAFWVVKLGTFMLCLSATATVMGRMPRSGLLGIIEVAALLALLATVMVLASTVMA